MIKSCLQDSPPAAGRFSDILPLRRSAILSGAFFVSYGEVSYNTKKGTGRHNSYVIRRLNDPVKSGAPNSHIDKQYTKLSEHLQAPIETFLPDCGMRTSREFLHALNR